MEAYEKCADDEAETAEPETAETETTETETVDLELRSRCSSIVAAARACLVNKSALMISNNDGELACSPYCHDDCSDGMMYTLGPAWVKLTDLLELLLGTNPQKISFEAGIVVERIEGRDLSQKRLVMTSSRLELF